jgi:hypothetical protein
LLSVPLYIFSSNLPKKMLASDGAKGFPIEVPPICK